MSLVQLELESPRAGASSAAGQARIVSRHTIAHEGNPQKILLTALEQIDLAAVDRIAATGRRFRTFVNLTAIPEPEAVEYAYPFVKPEGIDCPAIVSAGGETFMVYVLNDAGRIINVLTGNKCASGTGEFFLQQLRRLNVSLEEAAEWAATATPYHVSGRCSVFCKSDCTHATNKGIPRSEVTAGLCKMMAEKILELLKKIPRQNIMLTGGTALNRMMVTYLRQAIGDLVLPEEAPHFEALGAALWALDHETKAFPGFNHLFRSGASAFKTLPPLTDFESQVEFKTLTRGAVVHGDRCILGLDVGSTTTKAVLLRIADQAMLASVYLRTNGDPVGASRECYRAIHNQVQAVTDPSQIVIEGLGVCGSGRQIAGLHALTDGTINEIIAHATAAVHFDADVDTIFEIGGQDAKYTYIINGVPSDYAMNEACSAGTGSFLEESAYETLGVRMEDIAAVALRGGPAPDFNDQCAAFIASDIKNAIHEGVAHEAIVAGLVYSICMNYTNRVKGNRPVGRKVFMQGGVCYNTAVPLAMAALVGKPIIVPPEPGLMGAFGVALEVQKRLENGLIAPARFDLETLMLREVAYGKPFICRGGKEQCDRRCEIAMVVLEGKKYPFGGACNRYYNLRRQVKYDVDRLDLVETRSRLIFESLSKDTPPADAHSQSARIGFNRSFLVNTFFPLYASFFSRLGFQPVLPDEPSREGIDRRNAPFCYPAELAHGFFHTLLNSDEPPQHLFLPHFRAVPDQMDEGNSQVCPLVQGETFYLRAAFNDDLKNYEQNGGQLLTPLIDLTEGLSAAAQPLIESARLMGISRKAARDAFDHAVREQADCLARMKAIGRQRLAELEQDPDQIGVVIFSRPYNGMVGEAHMGIPHKIASRGITVIPFDYLDFDEQPAKRHMFWGMGQLILKAARFVKSHPQLFATFITNFSCGPDSFISGYFRDIMGRKPSLTLELDSHTADAGLETRIEAFLDIVAAYRRLVAAKQIHVPPRRFTAAQMIVNNGRPAVQTADGRRVALDDPRVTTLLPSMGRYSSEALAAVFRGCGYRALSHRPADEQILKLGRGHTTCKECLPLILTTGTLLDYVRNGRRADEILVYFMATGSGPCRFGQYRIFMEDLVRRFELPDVALLSLTADNSYVGMQDGFTRRAWWAVVVADVIEDTRSMLLAAAVDPDGAENALENEWRFIIKTLEVDDFEALEKQLANCAERLRRIPLKLPANQVPTIAITGEIFVRRDALSRQNLTEQLAREGFASICAPVHEWVQYCNWMVQNGLNKHNLTGWGRLKLRTRNYFQNRYEHRIKTLLARSGLVFPQPMDIQSVVACAQPYISPHLQGEAVLTVGSSLKEVASHACGVIAIGPFGCMPNRLSEALLNEAMTPEGKSNSEPHNRELQQLMAVTDDIPFLAIESDGSPFPQLITAKLETFCLRARRLHAKMTH